MLTFAPRLSCAALATAAFVLLLSSLPANVNAQRWPDPLQPEEVANLSHKARMVYIEASKDFDHIRYDFGVKKMDECAAIDSDKVALQFYNARIERIQALKKRGAEAKACYDSAIASLERIVKSPVSSEEEVARANELIKDMKRYKDGVDERDKRAVAVGLAVQRELATDLTKAMEEASKPKEKAGAAGGGEGGGAAGGGSGAGGGAKTQGAGGGGEGRQQMGGGNSGGERRASAGGGRSSRGGASGGSRPKRGG